MLHRFILITFISLIVNELFGQKPQNITFLADGIENTRGTLACADQRAGTVKLKNFKGTSVDTTRDTIYLSFGSEFDIVHNNDANLTGDPGPLTRPGITYGFFKCRPTTNGPDLTSILRDNCILNNPPPANGLWVTQGGTYDGNIKFQNDGSLQQLFNNRKPVMIWFAPLTVDNFATRGFEGNPLGPCVNLNVNETFAVVYLNEIIQKNENINAGHSGCLGTFELNGGSPEFDSSFYNIKIVNFADTTIKGSLVGGPFTHGDRVTFKVPVPAIYRIVVSDNKGSQLTFSMNMTACVTQSQSIQNATVVPGDTVCVRVTNEAMFTNILSMQYLITWDSSKLEYAGVKNLTNRLPDFKESTSFSSRIARDTLLVSWFNPGGTGISMPDGTVLYELCFRAKGISGTCADITFSEVPKIHPIEVFNGFGNQLGFNGVKGRVCFSAAAVQFSLSQDSVKCPGTADGRITIRVSNGKSPFKAYWRNTTTGGATQGPAIINVVNSDILIPNLLAGNYSVTVTDADTVSAIKEIKILSPPLLNILLTEIPPICYGQRGSITSKLALDTVVVSNPMASYKYLWSTGDTILSLINIPAGGYSLTVTDSETGCTVTNNTLLPQPPPYNVSISLDTASCTGKNDGGIRLVVSGGSPDVNGNYRINWPTMGPPPGILVTSDRHTLAGIEASVYPLRITDSSGCLYQQNIELPARKVLRINAVVNNINCSYDCSGTLFASGTITGGPPSPFNFQWFGTPPPVPPTVTPGSVSFNSLCRGIYSIVMTDTVGCTIDTTIQIVSPPALDLQLSSFANESCSPGKDGRIAVKATGGTKPYSYAWSNNASDTLSAGLSAGAYTIIATDSLLCKDTLLVSLTAPKPPLIQQLNDYTVPCSDSKNGVLTTIATPGDAGITSYLWSNGSSGSVLSGLTVGTYFVTVIDANNCKATDTALVISAPPMVLSNVNKTSPQCPGQGGGSLAVSITGGASPYFFQWSTGLSGAGLNVLGNVKAGDYNVTITDNNGCKFTPPAIRLDDPAAISVKFAAIDSVSCFIGGQVCDGRATANANYSDGRNGTFNFTWQSGEISASAETSTALGLCRGTQWLIVSDGTCFDTFRVIIPSPPPIVPGASISNVSCNGVSDGSVTLKPSGGSGPYNIFWASGQVGATISSLPAGNYTALIVDSKNCNFTHSVAVTQPDPFDVFVDITGTQDVSCPGDKDGSIAVLVQGGNTSLGGVQYVWRNGIAPATANSVKNLGPGVFVVTAIDQKGCTDTLTWTINEPPPIQFSLGRVAPIQCFGGNTFITVDSVWGGRQSIYQYSLDGGINRQIKSQSSVFAGEHLITVVDAVNLCSKDSNIIIKEPLQLSVKLPKILEIQLGDTLTRLVPEIISSVPVDTFIWSPPAQLSCNRCKNPIVNALKSQTYTLTVKDANGCTASGEVYVDVEKKRNVFIPNAFSPNDDGINDKFQIFTGLGVKNINFFRVYDRWGELMYEVLSQAPSPDGSIGWDGRFKGQKMMPAVFLYMIEVEYIDGRTLLYRGDVTLLR
jgi:gliding motility-associated-like protein